MDSIKKLNKYDDIKLAEIKYGLEGFYLNFTKLIIIIALALILDTTKYTLLFLLFNLPIRSVSFGFHANSSFQCLILSTITFIFIPLLANHFMLHVFAKCIIYFCLTVGFWIMAPKDTEKKPMKNNKKRFWLKIVSVGIVIAYFIISLILSNQVIINLMLLSLLVQLIMISPIPFLIFKQKYNFKWFK